MKEEAKRRELHVGDTIVIRLNSPLLPSGKEIETKVSKITRCYVYTESGKRFDTKDWLTGDRWWTIFPGDMAEYLDVVEWKKKCEKHLRYIRESILHLSVEELEKVSKYINDLCQDQDSTKK